MSNYRLFVLLVLGFLTQLTCAQDYHFSQFDANPFYLNPALTGERLSDYKGIQINGNYRNQMSRFTKTPGGYKSVALGIDEPINSKFSLGQFFYNNNAATGDINTFGLMLAGAYKIIDEAVENKGAHNLSMGIQLGFINKSVHPVNFTYDEQYSPGAEDGFDRTIPSGESFVQQSYYNFNVNYGIYYRGITKNKKLTGFGGFSIYNIAQSNESFTGTYSGLPLRYNLHGGILCKMTKQVRMMPQFLYMKQASASDLNAGVLLFSKMENQAYEFLYGIGFRNREAIIFQLGVGVRGITVRASYDVKTSYLKTYRNNGLEFSLVYIFHKKKGKQNKDQPQN